MLGIADSLKGTVHIYLLDKNIEEQASKQSPFHKKAHDSKLSNEQTPLPPGSSKNRREGKILKRTVQCCTLNGGVFWLSLILFEYGLLPAVRYLLTFFFGSSSSSSAQYAWSIIQYFLNVIFGTLWILPLFLLSKIVNSLWFQDIADSAFRYSRGRPMWLKGIGKFIADGFFSILIQTAFLSQTMLIGMTPVKPIGEVCYLVHMSMLYSLYSFEYKWYNMGYPLHWRLSYIETNWPYFLGFGFPLAILTNLTSSYMVSGCIFSILFPLFIVSANEAVPVLNTSYPKLKLFSPVVALSDKVVTRLFRSSHQT